MSDINRIRDPIHGYIKLSDDEINILDSSPMQRLRRVKQMSMSSLVYPSATHTRFSHSVGVMYTAGLFADSLELSDKKREELRIAGLVHDVGHGPFSHTSDRVAKKYGIKHEERSCNIIDKKLSDKIPSHIDIGNIKDHIRSESPLKIIAGDIDADRIDYLNRDAINTGLNHGSIDFETIIEFADIHNGRLVFDRKATYAITELLAARLYMHNAIMNHHVSRLAETILERALERYVENNSVEDMMSHNDYTMHTKLLNSSDDIKELYNRVRRRDLLKKCYSVRGDQVPVDIMRQLSEINAREYEEKIAEVANINPMDVVIVTPILSDSKQLNVPIKYNGEIKQLYEISELSKHLPTEKYNQSRFHIYSKEEHKEKINSIADEVLHNVIT